MRALLASLSHAETLLAHSRALLETQRCQDDCLCFQNRVLLLGTRKRNCFPCWLSWPQHSWAYDDANTPPSSLQRCWAFFPQCPAGTETLGSILSLLRPITGAAPWPWRVVPLLCTLLCSSMGQSQLFWSCTTVLTPSALFLHEGAAVRSPVCSEGGPSLPGLCCSSLAPAQHMQVRRALLYPPTGVSSRE